MPTAEIKTWLKARRRNALVLSAGYSILALAGGAILLLPMTLLIYAAAKLLVLIVVPTSSWLTVLSCGLTALGIGLIYVDSIFSERDDMSIVPKWLLRELVHAGPRLTLEGGREVLRAWQLVHLDIELCAKVLLYLATKSKAASKAELIQFFPGLGWEKLVAQLRLIDGVLIFRPGASRLSLTSALRLELREFVFQPEPGDFFEPDAPPIAVDEPEKLTPREILGVAPDASVAEIKSAYRSRVKECHPDRFAGADAASLALAEEWTKSLNAAYDTLIAQSRN